MILHLWNQFFVISCLLAAFLDPLLLLLLHVRKFRLAYVTTTPESRIFGAGELVDDPKKIAKNYFFGYFTIDLFVMLPLPQIIMLIILPNSMSGSRANYVKDLLRTAILIQYIPRLLRFLPLLAGSTSTVFTFESAWAHFFINLITFVLASHVVGSCWYHFGLQRVNQCFIDACHDTQIQGCRTFIDCGRGINFREFESNSNWELWKNSPNATDCFSSSSSFNFGIYKNAVGLTTYKSFGTRYIYSLLWGLRQISTLAGNLEPSYFVWEVLFMIGIIGTGLFLFALLIGNMQNFLQSIGRRLRIMLCNNQPGTNAAILFYRGFEMSIRRRDVERWMSDHCLPENLRRQVRIAERCNWAATRGVNYEMLMENLPEDLQRNIRRHLFKFIMKVRIFQLLDDPTLDAIFEQLRTKTYINGSEIFYRGCIIDKMVFIIRGRAESVGEDRVVVPLSEGNVCGEELLTWYLEHSSVNRGRERIRIPGHRLLSNRTVRCVSSVEAFVLRGVDLEEVTSLFSRFLTNPRLQAAIRSSNPSGMEIQEETNRPRFLNPVS